MLKGLNFVKNKQDPVALEDHEYPDWLWRVLEPKEGADGGAQGKGDEGDLFCMSQSQFHQSRRLLLTLSSEIKEAATTRRQGAEETCAAEPGVFGAQGAGV